VGERGRTRAYASLKHGVSRPPHTSQRKYGVRRFPLPHHAAHHVRCGSARCRAVSTDGDAGAGEREERSVWDVDGGSCRRRCRRGREHLDGGRRRNGGGAHIEKSRRRRHRICQG
jgi:hypothetical protein